MKRKPFVTFILCISSVAVIEIFGHPLFKCSDKDKVTSEQVHTKQIASLVADNDTLKAVKRWIKHHAIPLRAPIAASACTYPRCSD
jgi:hypothetical protein